MGRGPVLCRSAVFLRLILKPLDPWFATAALATRIADLRQRAANQPVELSLTVYLGQERAVVTEVDERAWIGDAPNAAVRVPLVAPAPAAAPATDPIAPRRPRLPPAEIRGATTECVRHRTPAAAHCRRLCVAPWWHARIILRDRIQYTCGRALGMLSILTANALRQKLSQSP